MITSVQIDRAFSSNRNEYVNRVVSVLINALHYVYESNLTRNRRRRESLLRASRRILDNALPVEALRDIRFRGRRGAFAQAVAEAMGCEGRLKHLVESRARRPGALYRVEVPTFWRTVRAVLK